MMKWMGHRGARDHAPENTIRSLKAALELGLPAVEFDIHETRDGVWVVHHDETLDRTTTSTGKVGERTWQELTEVRTKEGDLLPRLEEVFQLFADSKVELQVELKSSGDWMRLAALLKTSYPTNLLTVISFNHRWLQALKQVAPEIRTTCLLYGLPVNPLEIAKSVGAQGLSLSVQWLDAQFVKECHAGGLLVTAWNANDPETYRAIRDMGVDYLGTDCPSTAMTW